MTRTHAVHPPHGLAMPGWIRQCTVCGMPDIHAVYPCASMLDQPGWTCSTCGAGQHAAIHVPFDATECPALAVASNSPGPRIGGLS